MAKDILVLDDMYLSEEMQDLILECALEFVRMLTSQANEICQKETRNGFITLQHILRACQELGFQEYIHEITRVGKDFEQQLKVLQKVSHLFCKALMY